MIKRYYDHNTRLFLALGGSRRIRAIHRALWAPGVRNREQALDAIHTLVSEQIGLLGADTPHVLDLGCGVGGSLFSLAQKLPPGWCGTGTTISPVQFELAQAFARQRGLAESLTFLDADFLHLPDLPPVDLAFAIESFALNADAPAFFSAAARVLRPGGRLVIVDDFLTKHGADDALSAREGGWLEAFRSGWLAAGLGTPNQAIECARTAGLSLMDDRDLTPMLRLNTLRDRAVRLSVQLGRFLRLKGLYWDSLYGGDALQRCLEHDLISYRLLVFTRPR